MRVYRVSQKVSFWNFRFTNPYDNYGPNKQAKRSKKIQVGPEQSHVFVELRFRPVLFFCDTLYIVHTFADKKYNRYDDQNLAFLDEIEDIWQNWNISRENWLSLQYKLPLIDPNKHSEPASSRLIAQIQSRAILTAISKTLARLNGKLISSGEVRQLITT